MEEFISHFKDIFDFDLEEEGVILTKDTKFKDLDDWDSLTALGLIALADEEYDVRLSGDDIRELDTLQQLVDLLEQRKNA